MNDPNQRLKKNLSRLWAILLTGTSVSYLITDYKTVDVTLPLTFILLFVLIVITCVIFFHKVFGLERIAYGLVTFILLLILFPSILDIPVYLKHEYQVVEGVPTKFELHNAKSKITYFVEIEGVDLHLPFKDISMKLSHRWFVVTYLPHSRIVMDYKILSEEQTIDKVSFHKK